MPEFDELLTQLPTDFRARVAAWREHPRVLALRDESHARNRVSWSGALLFFKSFFAVVMAMAMRAAKVQDGRCVPRGHRR